jgi:hypothetical protein
VHEGEAGDEVFLEGGEEFRRAVTKSDRIIATGVVYDSVNLAMRGHNVLNGFFERSLVGHFHDIGLHAVPLGGLLVDDISGLLRVAPKNARNSTLFSEGSGDSGANALGATGDEDDCIGELKVH